METYRFLPGRRGFTLIELMVVVAIIGILMAAGIVVFSDAQKAARDAKRRADVDAIAKALEQYYQDRGAYYHVNISSTMPTWDDSTRKAHLGIYFPSGSLPVDPLNTSSLYYRIISVMQNQPGAVNPQTRFCVSARLEQNNGNCNGDWSTSAANPNSFQCMFVTPGTGTTYCAQNRQ